MKDKFICDQCGACCSTFPIFAGPNDLVREPRIGNECCKIAEWEMAENKTYQLHPLPFHSSCAFLGKNKLCEIYETRPTVCRAFEAGSALCIEARVRKGLQPLLPLK